MCNKHETFGLSAILLCVCWYSGLFEREVFIMVMLLLICWKNYWIKMRNAIPLSLFIFRNFTIEIWKDIGFISSHCPLQRMCCSCRFLTIYFTFRCFGLMGLWLQIGGSTLLCLPCSSILSSPLLCNTLSILGAPPLVSLTPGSVWRKYIIISFIFLI